MGISSITQSSTNHQLLAFTPTPKWQIKPYYYGFSMTGRSSWHTA